MNAELIDTQNKEQLVEPIIPQLRKAFDLLISQGYLSSLNHLNYFEELKDVIFSDIINYLKSKEKHYIPDIADIPDKPEWNSSKPVKYFSLLMERELILTNYRWKNHPQSRRHHPLRTIDNDIFDRWVKQAQRQYNLNQLV